MQSSIRPWILPKDPALLVDPKAVGAEALPKLQKILRQRDSA